MEACVVRPPRSSSKSPPKRRPLTPESTAPWQVEEDETKIWLWDSGLMRWLRMSRIGRYLCLTAILLLQLVVLLLIMWLVSFLHAGLAVPCFVVLFSLWAYSERRHAAFSDYLKHLCKMAHGPPAD